MERPIITIGIVTFNSSRSINPCLNSIAKNTKIDEIEIVVVDNGSDDDTVTLLKDIPFIHQIIKNEKNTGFASAVNRIIDSMTGRHLLLLNPDCTLDTPLLPTISEIFSASGSIGIIGADIRDPYGIPREAYGVFPTPGMIFWDFSGLRKLAPRKNWSMSIPFSGNSPQEVDFPTGAFFCIRDAILRTGGKFDEIYFAYFEEVDFALRAREKGYNALIHPDLRVKHIGGGSFQAAENRYGDDFQLSCWFDSLFKFMTGHYSDGHSRNLRRFIKMMASIKAGSGGNSIFGRRHRQVVRILNLLDGSDVRNVYEL